MINDQELEALLAYVAELEAQVAERDERIDFLMRERAVLSGGHEQLEREYGRRGAADNPQPPPGRGYGNAGQLVVTDHEEIYALLREQRRSNQPKRTRKTE